MYTIVRSGVYKKRTGVVNGCQFGDQGYEINQQDAQFGPKSTGQSATLHALFVVILIGRL